MNTDKLLALVESVLNERKAQDIIILDVRGRTSFTDYMVVVTGTSNRHIKTLCDYVDVAAKESGFYPLGMEGDMTSDWVLLDLGDVIVQAMTIQARDHYQLEKLWTVGGEKENIAA